ncbi:MAG: hypothetical protein HFE63_05015 [Clostridiales bacterium]|nr:hypothetical protein [Clostridiales bacterium]
MKKTKKIALAAILSALGVVILLLGSIIEILDLTMVAIASMLVFLTVIEIGGGYPYLVWLVTGTLSLLLLPSKFAALLYMLFGGIYPILKAMFERLHYIVSWILKFSFFNSILTLLILLSNYVFHIPDTELGFHGMVYLLCNGVFFLYDIAATQIVTLYLVKLRKMLGLKNFFK